MRLVLPLWPVALTILVALSVLVLVLAVTWPPAGRARGR